MYAKDAAIRAGQSVTIEVSNRPYIDQSIPPESNDYRWVDCATIEIYDTENCLIAHSEMDKIYTRPGWYSYRLQTKEHWQKGVYRVVVKLATNLTPGTSGTSGTPSTTGCGTISTTGCPSSGCGEEVSDVKVSYFRLMDLY